MRHVIIVLAILLSAPNLRSQTAPLDLLIRGGRVIDGTGAPARDADVGVRNGRIVSVGRITEPEKATIDAKGLVVAPGFIDVHTHVDEIATQPSIPHFVRMGVTTVVAGNCDTSAPDVAKAFGEIETARPALNYATLIGHNTVRREVMATDRLWGSRLRRSSGSALRAIVGLGAFAPRMDGCANSRPGRIFLPRAA